MMNVRSIGKLISCGIYTSSVRFLSKNMSWKEVRIPSPYGEVAGKWWGPLDQRPIVGLHGWQDNSGTYDTLAPLLSPNVSLLALDLPGHGLSTQIPPGAFYHGIDATIFLRKLLEHFGWSKISLMAHSFGAITSYSYTMLFPETVDFLICFDNLSFVIENREKRIEKMVKTIDKFLRYDELNNRNDEPPSYTYRQLEELLHKGTRKSIDLDKCKYILDRNIAPSKNVPNRYYFTRDSRLKVGPLMTWSQELIYEGTQKISCPVFLAVGKKSIFYAAKSIFLGLLDVIKENNYTEFHVVDGLHHFHLNNPEKVAPLVNSFIEKCDKFDRSFEIGTKLKIVELPPAISTQEVTRSRL